MSVNQSVIRKTHSIGDQSGFSIIELAVALIVIGALIGMLLKGQDIVQSARIVQTAKHLKIIDAGFAAFRGNYNETPDDLADPARYIRGCTTGNGCLPGGNGDGIIGTSSDEGTSWYIHLQLLDLVPKDYTGSYLSQSLQIEYQANGLFGGVGGHHYLKDSGFHVKAIEKLDKTMDDGKPQSGRIVTSTNCVTTGKNEYNIIGNESNCTLLFQMKY